MRCASFRTAASLLVTLAVSACGPAMRTNVVADAPPVPAGREIRFHEGRTGCETEKIADLRVAAHDWPEARPEVETEVRKIGGEAVEGWSRRTVMVGGRESGVPGGTGEPREELFWFGVVVRYPGECPVT